MMFDALAFLPSIAHNGTVHNILHLYRAKQLRKSDSSAAHSVDSDSKLPTS